MYQGYHRIFWGLIFITFHINLGSLQILPGFVGCLVIVSGAGLLVGQHSSELFRKTLITAWFLAFISLCLSLTGWMHYQSLWLSFFPVAFAAGEFAFCYYLLEGGRQQLIEAGEEAMASELEGQVFTLLMIYVIFIILECIGIALNHQSMLIMVAIFGLLPRILVMAKLRKLMNVQPSEVE